MGNGGTLERLRYGISVTLLRRVADLKRVVHDGCGPGTRKSTLSQVMVALCLDSPLHVADVVKRVHTASLIAEKKLRVVRGHIIFRTHRTTTLAAVFRTECFSMTSANNNNNNKKKKQCPLTGTPSSYLTPPSRDTSVSLR